MSGTQQQMAAIYHLRAGDKTGAKDLFARAKSIVRNASRRHEPGFS